LEIISSDVSGTKAFQILCKILNKEDKKLVLSSILDDQLRDIISISLESDPAKRATLNDLLNHPFLQKSENDHNPVLFSV
jgi:serine/threonine protein kinase